MELELTGETLRHFRQVMGAIGGADWPYEEPSLLSSYRVGDVWVQRATLGISENEMRGVQRAVTAVDTNMSLEDFRRAVGTPPAASTDDATPSAPGLFARARNWFWGGGGGSAAATPEEVRAFLSTSPPDLDMDGLSDYEKLLLEATMQQYAERVSRRALAIRQAKEALAAAGGGDAGAPAVERAVRALAKA